MTKSRGRPAHPDVLTPAEWRVVETVRHGLTNPDIARRQGVSMDAVKYHVANALQKLGLSSRLALRQWDGVRRDSILFGKERSMNETLTLGPIGRIARSVKDIQAARRWYGEVLGLHIHAAQAGLSARGIVFLNAPHMIHRHDDRTEEWMAFIKDIEDRPWGLCRR